MCSVTSDTHQGKNEKKKTPVTCACAHTAPCPEIPCEIAPRLVAAAASAWWQAWRVASGGGGGCRRAGGDRRGTAAGSRRRRRHHQQQPGKEKARLASDDCLRLCLSPRPPSRPYPMIAAPPRSPSTAGYLQARGCTNIAGGPVFGV